MYLTLSLLQPLILFLLLQLSTLPLPLHLLPLHLPCLQPQQRQHCRRR
jgi:hypothetical protein